MKISLAELEYRIEKDQIDIINLSQKIQSLRMANEKDSFVDDVGKEECLYKYITKYEITFLVAADLESARYVNLLDFVPTLFYWTTEQGLLKSEMPTFLFFLEF